MSRTSLPNPAHSVHPYIVWNSVVEHANQAWMLGASYIEKTVASYTELLKLHKVRIGMGGRCHDQDNIFIEQLW